MDERLNSEGQDEYLPMEVDLREALSVEPSAGFRARLTARIADERQRPAQRVFTRPTLAAALAAAVLLFAIAIAGRLNSRPEPVQRTSVPVPPATITEDANRRTEPPIEPKGVVAEAPVEAQPAIPAAPARRAQPALPPLLIDPREREGFRRLVAAIAAGQIPGVDVASERPRSADGVDAIAQLEIPPLAELAPIDLDTQ